MQQQMQEPMEGSEDESVPGMGIFEFYKKIIFFKNFYKNDNPQIQLSSIAPNWRQIWDTIWPCPNCTLKTSTQKESVFDFVVFLVIEKKLNKN